MLNIRKIKLEDKKIYLEMVNEFYNSEAVLHSVDENNFINTFSELIKSDVYTECFIIEYHDKIVGYTLVSKTYSQESGGMVLLIEEIYINEKFRSKGIGKEIFDFLKTRYSSYSRVRLEVEISNKKAIKLYEKLGFNELKYIQMIKE